MSNEYDAVIWTALGIKFKDATGVLFSVVEALREPLAMSATYDSCVLMIADGMGGHAQGALASGAALDYLVTAIDRLSNPVTGARKGFCSARCS